jgi:uncharacterized protein involved in exopolysaccharide biosynthesis
MKRKTVLDFFRVVYRRKKAVGVIMAVAVGSAIVLSLVLPKMYEATVTVFPPKNLSGGSRGLGSLVGTPISAVLSPEPLKYYLGIINTTAVAEQVAARVPERSIQRLKRNLAATTTRTNLIQISYFDRDQKIAAKVANAYVEGLNAYFENLSQEEINRLSKFVEIELDKASKEYMAASDSLRAFKEEHKTVSLNDEISHLISASAQLEAQQRALVVDLEENRRRTQETEAELKTQLAEDFSSGSLVENPMVQQIQSRLNDLELRLTAAQQEMTEAHPAVLLLRTQIEQTKTEMQQEIRRILDSETRGINAIGERLKGELIQAQIQRSALLARETALQEVAASMDSTLRSMPAVTVQYAQLLKLTDLYGRLRDSMANRLQDIRVQSEKEVESFLVVDAAVVPPRPGFPNLGINVLVALGFSLLGGVFYCFLLEYIEDLVSES